MRWLSSILVLALAISNGACDSSSGTPAPQSSTASPPAGPTGSPTGSTSAQSGSADTPPAAFPKQIVKATGDKNLVTLARPLLVKTVAADGFRLVLHWQDAKLGKLTEHHPLGRQTIDWAKTVASLRLHIHPPGVAKQTLAVKAATRSPETQKFYGSASLVIRLDAEGVKRRKGTEGWPWERRADDLFSKAGSYSVRVAGTLALDREEVPFETGAMIFEIVAPSASFKPLSEIEAVAAARVKADKKIKEPLRPSKETVADEAGNRVVRFAVPVESGRHDQEFVEVVLDPGGKVLALESRKIFSGRLVDNKTTQSPESRSLHQDAWELLWDRPGASKVGAGTKK
jgi:hypothetical protein